MIFKHLRTFITVIDQGSVSKAALHLRIAQPALSRHIRDLERELGLRLFDRVGHRLLLTGEGARLLESCRRPMGDVNALSEQAQQLQQGDQGVLKVAASPVQIETVLSSFLHRYAQHYPRVDVRLVEAAAVETLNMLDRGEVQLAFTVDQPEQIEDRGFGSCALPPAQLFAAWHRKFPIDVGATVEIDCLAPHPLLLLNYGFFARRKFDSACSLAGIKPNIVIESQAPHVLLTLAEARYGVAILPSAVRTDRYDLRISHITFRDNPLRIPLVIA
jgi:DNA-binding transcriptional LysR family regulator